MAEPWIEKGVHPHVIIGGFTKALDDALSAIQKYSITVDMNNREEVIKVIKTCIGTKFISRWSDLMCNLAIEAVQTVNLTSNGHREIDIKRFVKIEKVSENCCSP